MFFARSFIPRFQYLDIEKTGASGHLLFHNRYISIFFPHLKPSNLLRCDCTCVEPNSDQGIPDLVTVLEADYRYL